MVKIIFERHTGDNIVIMNVKKMTLLFLSIHDMQYVKSYSDSHINLMIRI